MHYLVINDNKNGLYSFARKYQLFDDRQKAIDHYVDIGGDVDNYGIGLSNTVGIASVERCGLIDVMFLPIEIQ